MLALIRKWVSFFTRRKSQSDFSIIVHECVVYQEAELRAPFTGEDFPPKEDQSITSQDRVPVTFFRERLGIPDALLEEKGVMVKLIWSDTFVSAKHETIFSGFRGSNQTSFLLGANIPETLKTAIKRGQVVRNVEPLIKIKDSSGLQSGASPSASQDLAAFSPRTGSPTTIPMAHKSTSETNAPLPHVTAGKETPNKGSAAPRTQTSPAQSENATQTPPHKRQAETKQPGTTEACVTTTTTTSVAVARTDDTLRGITGGSALASHISDMEPGNPATYYYDDGENIRSDGEDPLISAKDYWRWDIEEQNYFHIDVEADGSQTKVWYPREFD